MGRLEQLEARNERLFQTLGRFEFYVEEKLTVVYTVDDVLEILKNIKGKDA